MTCARGWWSIRTTAARYWRSWMPTLRGVAFMLNAVGIDSVMLLADKGERMPQKSTFFHPKLGTGLVFHPLEP